MPLKEVCHKDLTVNLSERMFFSLERSREREKKIILAMLKNDDVCVLSLNS